MLKALTFAATVLAAAFVGSAACADSIDLPPGSVVTVMGRTAEIALSNNARGKFNCSCPSGKGSCAVDVNHGALTCGAATGGSCKGSCRFDAGTPGFRAAIAAATAHAAAESHVPQ
jgi:hypothetical protein